MQGNLKDAIQYASQNPTSQFASQLAGMIKTGQFDEQAKGLGIDLSPIKQSALGSAPQASATPPVTLPGQETTQNFAQGVAKGEISTVKGLSDLGEKVANNTVGRVINLFKGNGFTPTDTSGGTGSTFDTAVGGTDKSKSLTQPSNLAEQAGYGSEKLAEFFIPASKAAQAERAVNILSKGIESPLLASAVRIGGKAAIQGTAAGAVRAAQTGGDVQQTLETAASAGLVRGGMAVIGEGANALHLPERLYSTIFKNSANDMLSELKAGGLQKLQETNPQKYQDFITKGIIKVGADGTPTLNDTLAEQALNNGLRGSIRNMANTVVEGTLDSENQARTIAQNYTGTVNLAEPQIKNVLTSIGQEYADVGFGEISKEADRLANAITTGRGDVSAVDALDIRRLLDKARIARSFDTQASKLSLGQQNLKTLADAVRSRVNAIPEMGDVMKNYSFNLDAMEALAKEAARRGNNQVLSLIDSLFLSGAYGANNPVPGVTIGMLRKVAQSAWGTTALGQAVKNSAVSPLTSGLVSSGSAGATSALTSQ